MKILLIEDDDKIAEFIMKGLKQNGDAVDRASDGEEGLHLLLDRYYDVAIVDIMLPKLDGLTVVESIRREHLTTPVIFLSAKHSVDDRVKGLQIGGDDYLVKPFAFTELLARIQALARRTSSVFHAQTLTIGDLRLDPQKHTVFCSNTKIELQPREFMLLEYLMRHAGRVVSKTMIMENLWNYQFDPQTNVVEACICRLRNKIDEGRAGSFIRTIRGIGYVFDKPD